MSDFSLINSLINPPAEPLVEAEQPAPAAPAAAVEEVIIDELETTAGPSFDYEYRCDVHVSYYHPNLPEDGIQLTVDATLKGDFRVEDDRFSAPYGSTTAHGGGVYSVYDSLELTDVSIKHRENNFEFFKLPPEQAKHVGEFVTNYLKSLKSDELEKHVDADAMADEIAEKQKHDNEPDYDDGGDDYY